MSAPVFLAPAAAFAAVGDVLELDGDEARHAVTVQRRRVGEVVDLVDGAGLRARGPIVSTGDRSLAIRVEAVSRDDDPPLTLVQALAKGGRDEQALEAATELGATRIVPWAADRSIVQWRGAKADKARGQWESLARAAAKQSRRATVPAVAPVATTRQLAGLVRDAVAAGERVLVLHEESAAPLTALTWDDAGQGVWCIVGPEGGISDAEVAALTEAGAEPVLLGPHVLRASSAGPAAFAALAACRGTWNTLGA
ncbi:16S rRNA (uracil(1498)-N(3))-methyltransferase [Demequina sp. SYSU T00039]|uniref:Ribosomal RNA small subunit methyltransferase E n=1 Tax=Demequina lignilytica TaxID=3051663 RepID=A0AAW7M890_9MICO|nr:MULTISPECIES: 16S rRNA (uracil(1498)-N(3))-methyltransferase [unclassified Demequina]MDN4478466.1 16S rRNA (uracil(1498)-N(3))-methyltransferase [Demequina sp. SYSU T00039-1]MDN4487027.1 16S rRNA (uracil(1498)-N(3))-methyltransferase [Demequina sp. SYSU T00039]MDN4489738.1 16S rRNA (uracil(1498)-N(3))-methyltransferase [Demequina sp. SYSU T00068]